MLSLTKVITVIALAAGHTIAFAGDMTYFNPGLGSCGWTNGDGDAIVALSTARPGNCGRNIRISYGGRSAVARVVDACPGCSVDSIDVAPYVFDKLANRDQGRVHVNWEFV
ncbi:RlpA-like double-psi beta-barrel-protein domain-containing protein-containing protein [Xylaria palmicola]|nr:RlpA-like double-psi beta-barrel-protein domain-containing protein-containing protein [Xylaria palmicola]